MSKTYNIKGIIVQKQGFGENDLLITLLSPENGLIKAIAPNARKYQSTLRGKTELFVVNNFLIIKGRNLDRISQVDTEKTYHKLSQSLGKLTVSQYLAELVLNLAITQQPQPELYTVFNEHLKRIEQLSPKENLYPYIAQAVFHFLAIAGIAPNMYNCLKTQQPITPNFEQQGWKVGFSFKAGGLLKTLNTGKINHDHDSMIINSQLNALELALFQSLAHKVLLPISDIYT
ncbi:DNA repair protein RecO [Geminocystis sp. GBBB08]|uniref:DNA repair protein RecO n=1 Tax=Geminocystis sp. GBBB08 TaxID=2604140 RepID=UPI0027E33E99|nr:DNA repair protein RecO [Geminocystis sp. GBBB08]MBL1208456.1 DNA repair protein RecO [Geminocystis sp. GBBB08]